MVAAQGTVVVSAWSDPGIHGESEGGSSGQTLSRKTEGRGHWLTDRHPLFLLRFVLAVGSAVFDAMFNGGMATTSTEIELPDVEPAAFLALLKYVCPRQGKVWKDRLPGVRESPPRAAC